MEFFFLENSFSIDIRPFNIRSIKPAIGDTTSKHNARSTGIKFSKIV
jgi:hypothetical protein